MQRIDPYESPARALNRENRALRLQANVANNIPGFGTPADRNSMGSAPREASPDNWDKQFSNTDMPKTWVDKFPNYSNPLTATEQQSVMKGVQRRQALASLPQRPPRIPPFQTTGRPMAVGQYKATNPKTGQVYGTASVSDAGEGNRIRALGGTIEGRPETKLPSRLPVTQTTGRIMDETGDRTAGFAQKPNPAPSTPRTASTPRKRLTPY